MTATLLLTGGEIVDGTGSPRYPADVVVRDGVIQAIEAPGSAGPDDVATRVDIGGLVVAPGFIDMHAHSDLAVLADDMHLAKVGQGVTLEVVGQDGIGYAPVTDDVMRATREQIAAWNGEPDLDYSWRSVADYLDRVDAGSPVNVAVLVPHGTVRMTVMGMSDRAADPAELERMRAIIARGLRDGAVGVSAGLSYAPGMYASDDELVDVLAPLRELGGFYAPHHRNYGAGAIEAYAECIDVARRARVALHLTHCNVNFPVNRGRAGEVIAQIDAAIAEGMDVTLDNYPYLMGSTYLASRLPSWAHQGGRERTLGRLADPGTRARILHEIEHVGSDGHHGVPIEWETIVISSVESPHLLDMVGATLPELAAARGTSPGELFCELLIEDDLRTGCLVQSGNEENVRRMMEHPTHMVGSDGILVGDRPHPRGWGSFPRFLGHYARDLGMFTLEEAIAHVTSRPARRLGLAGRGTVVVGGHADLVVFDPATIADTADYERPRSQPTGIRHVLVNGAPTLWDGERTGALPGRALRRG